MKLSHKSMCFESLRFRIKIEVFVIGAVLFHWHCLIRLEDALDFECDSAVVMVGLSIFILHSSHSF